MRGTRAWPPTGLIPWFSKTEGNTYATLLHHPLLFGEIQRSAQEVAAAAAATRPTATTGVAALALAHGAAARSALC